ncbi:MAG: efflux RND transporter periplasmic adaptor subunit, partial [Janthinobacterium lividum]
MTKRTKIFVPAILCLGLAGTFAYRQVQSANAAGQVHYRTDTAADGDVTDTVEASGVVQPLTIVDLKSRAGGRLIKLAVDVGTRVKPGTLIARIDPSDTLSAYNQSVADLVTARARLSQSQQQARMLGMQDTLTVSGAQQGLSSAQAKLTQAKRLAEVQPALTDSAIAEAQANLTSAQQQYEQLRTAGNPQAIASAQSVYAQARANVAAADAAYNRQNSLSQKGFVAQQSVDTALAARDVARATLDEARQRLQTISADQKASLAGSAARVSQAKSALVAAQTNRYEDATRQQDVTASRAALLQAKIGVQNAQAGLMQGSIRQSDIQAAQAAVSKAQAEVNNTLIQLHDATIYSPRNGVILQKYIEEGTIISSGESLSSDGTKIVQVGDVSSLFIDVSVDESDIGKISMGQKVTIALDAVPGAKPEGRVVRIDPQAINDRDVTTIHVRVEIKNPDAAIKPGMNATCQFILRDVHGVLVVPSDAVKEGRTGGNTVRVLTKDNKAEV